VLLHCIGVASLTEMVFLRYNCPIDLVKSLMTMPSKLMEKVLSLVNCFKQNLWTGILGCVLAMLLPLATVTHALNSACWEFPDSALLVAEKCSFTGSKLRLFDSSRVDSEKSEQDLDCSEQDHRSDTNDCSSPDKSTDAHDSSTSNHDLFHHCHSANCFFVGSGQRTSNFNPRHSAFIYGGQFILVRSYGLVGEDIEPPKFW
jgi:hypothetical protein